MATTAAVPTSQQLDDFESFILDQEPFDFPEVGTADWYREVYNEEPNEPPFYDLEDEEEVDFDA